MKTRKIYAVHMTYDVPDEEKYIATKLLMNLDHLLKIIRTCNEHLDLMYTPFKDNQNITPEQAFSARAALRRYRDKVIENFNNVKKQAFRCFTMLKPFSTDTQIIKLIKSFNMCIDDLEKQVNKFVELFSNLESKEFGAAVVKAIEGIKKEISELDQVVEDRIKSHIESNILARNWIDNVSDVLQEKVEQKVPLSVELVNERNEKMHKNDKNNQ